MNLPYISDTGAYPPESCIFAQFLNFGALLVGVDVYIRYKQVEDHKAIELLGILESFGHPCSTCFVTNQRRQMVCIVET
jgi:hypothetical protein